MESIRIRTTPNGEDKHIKVQLNQSFDFLEILSLKLRQEELYRVFAADYGVIVGRVIANQGFGVPNAKVSVFIPLDDNENNPEIRGRYPYKTVQDKNSGGVRYNLLEDTQQGSCHVPIGTFPNKRKMLDNDVWLEIYDKYYKFTTTTNFAGDFMIFGVPTGNQKLHMDVDLSDIGFLSLKPHDLITQGYSPDLFDTNTTFRTGTDLDSLVQVQSGDFNVNVKPFWGDVENNEVGINRVDFNVGARITPNSTFFGSIFSEKDDKALRKNCRPRSVNGKNCDLTTGTGTVEYIKKISRDSSEVEYVSNNNTKIDENGNWAFQIPLNLDSVVTDEFGNLIPSEDPTVGIPTRALVRFRISMDEHRFGLRKRSAHYLVPNMYNRFDFGSDTDKDDFFEIRWKKAYSVTNYIPRFQKNNNDESPYFTGIKEIQECQNTNSFPWNRINPNYNFFYGFLCTFIQFAGAVITFLNFLIRNIIFRVVLTFVCFVKHPFNSNRRSACRCKSCLNLNDGESPIDWDKISGDELPCAACYDGGDSGQTYGVQTATELSGDSVSLPTATNGTYTGIQSITSGDGEGAIFDVVVSGGVVISVICVLGGTGYANGDTVTIEQASITGMSGDIVINLSNSNLTTIIIVDGETIDCEDFDYSICDNECDECNISLITLQCDDEEFQNGNEWADCVATNLAENLGVIEREFYNDFVIGSLYSYLFDYKVRFRRKRNIIYERFCDYECREIVGTPSGDKHYRNRCPWGFIVDKEKLDFYGTYSSGQVALASEGLIVEYNELLYYAARRGVDVNESSPSDLTVSQKAQMLFATNLIELGSVVSCDIDGEPYVIDRLNSSSYKDTEATKTLYDVSNCTLPLINKINRTGISLISQAGVDLLVEEAEKPFPVIAPEVFDGADGDRYTIIGNTELLPDHNVWDENETVIIFDRDDVVLRRLLCENFNYFSVTGTYSTTDHPDGSPNYVVDDEGNQIESVSDVCDGLDNIGVGANDPESPIFSIHPYYLYFGINKGKTSLDKLRQLYFDNCFE